MSKLRSGCHWTPSTNCLAGEMFHVEHRIVCIELDGFDDAILRGARHDAETCRPAPLRIGGGSY